MGTKIAISEISLNAEIVLNNVAYWRHGVLQRCHSKYAKNKFHKNHHSFNATRSKFYHLSHVTSCGNLGSRIFERSSILITESAWNMGECNETTAVLSRVLLQSLLPSLYVYVTPCRYEKASPANTQLTRWKINFNSLSSYSVNMTVL
jgi:hypothetical protein